jgi:hypothetical protein
LDREHERCVTGVKEPTAESLGELTVELREASDGAKARACPAAHRVGERGQVPTIAASYQDLLTAPNTAVLTTLLTDGSPNSSPVWFWFDGTEVVVSTLTDRAKHRNVQRDPRVSFTVVDPNRPLRYLEIRGTVAIDDDPNGEMRDRIAIKHGYEDGGAFDPPGSTRVNLRLAPTHIIEH